jgi:cytochrome c oxidase subunit 2
MSRINHALVSSGLAAAALWLPSAPARAGWEVNMPRGVTPISETVYDLHMLVFWICVAIGILVFGTMAIAMVRHRKSRGVQAAHFHHSTKAEIVWTIIPFLILVGMAVEGTKALVFMEDTSNPDLTIQVTGFQWGWHYQYPAEGIDFYSTLAESSRAAIYANPREVKNYLLEVNHNLVVPTGKKIRFLITSKDVIHSWWVPELGQKKDAIPGYVNEIWAKVEKPGLYRGQCTELCGAYHGFMPIVVEAKPEDEYLKWVAAQKQAQASKPGAAAQANPAGDKMLASTAAR